jgi:hypothetical protein
LQIVLGLDEAKKLADGDEGMIDDLIDAIGKEHDAIPASQVKASAEAVAAKAARRSKPKKEKADKKKSKKAAKKTR